MQRKTASYEFNTKSLRSFVVETVQWEIRNRLVPVLSSASKTGRSLDLQDVLQRFGFDNICRVAFGVDPACLLPSMPTSPFAEAFLDATDLSAGRFMYAVPFLWRVKRMLNIGSEKRLRRALKVVDEFASEVVSSRRKQISVERLERNDLLSRFIAVLIDNSNRFDKEVYFEDDKKLSGTIDTFLKETVVSYFLAGRDSTSVALTWFFWLLTCYPRVEESIHSDILQILAKRLQPTTADEEGISSFLKN
ncbi:hypothetical protein SUGI_1031760 [Cryptomeria japonica]|nr:hypothetical protein SUGI_1031760 [Cryptomeria japonica]